MLGYINKKIRTHLSKRCLFLCYHRVGNDISDKWGNCVNPENFNSQMEILRKYFNPLSISSLFNQDGDIALKNKRSVVITFDDGYDVNTEYAYEILQKSCAALVASGTATLETALFRIPQIVCYKSSWISIMIGRFLLRNLKFISLVNLILNKEVVKELIQENLNEKNLTFELNNILSGEKRKNILESYNQLIEKLGTKGASKKTALKIFNYLDSNSYSKEL